MTKPPTFTTVGVNALLDKLLQLGDLKNDAALSRDLEVMPPVISKLRSGILRLGASMILRIHDAFDMPIHDIRALAAGVAS
ncbi:hypothetical protein [Rugamonas sp.]|uniref:hypothetical protein n=1 Tax=Rugamonas sp. TaxID=1926287 RepID=UPI0025E471D4|nr:hypothetical protein [Rugamonas sp.]